MANYNNTDPLEQEVSIATDNPATPVYTTAISTERASPLFDGATHVLHSLTKVYSSFDTDALPVAELPAGTQVAVKEFDLGAGFSFGLFALEDGTEYYILENALDILSVSISRIKPTELIRNLNQEVSESFEDAEINFPFYKDGEYCVKFDTGMSSEEEVLSRIEDYQILAIKEIMDYYGKVRTDEDLFMLRNVIGFINTKSIILPARKGSTIRIVLGIQSKYLDAIPNRSIEVIGDMYSSIIAQHFMIKDISNIVSRLKKAMSKYSKAIEKFGGSIEGINLNKLSEKLQRFYGDLKKLLKRNDIIIDNLSSDSKVEMGFNPSNLRLEYVIIYSSPGKFLNVGVNKFSEGIDAKLAKTLITSKQILESAESGQNWQSFLTNSFGGDFGINFAKPEMALGSHLPLSDLEAEVEKYKDQFENPFKTAQESMRNSAILSSEEYKTIASQYLDRARNEIGDNFLKNLPEIIENVNDLDSLYELVFDKVSVEDLKSIIMKKASDELGVKDLNEIKARAIAKIMDVQDIIQLTINDLTAEARTVVLRTISENYNFAANEIDQFLESFDTNLYNHLLHYDDDGNLKGMLSDVIEQQGANEAIAEEGMRLVKGKLDDLGYTDCISLALNLKYRDVFETETSKEIIYRILSGEIPKFQNPCQELAQDIKDLLSTPIEFDMLKLDIQFALGKLEPKKLRTSIDLGFKELFKMDSNFFQVLLNIPKFRFENDKMSKSRENGSRTFSGIDIDIDLPSFAGGFERPSLKSVNPSFDFSGFQLGGVDDIFSGALKSIESGIIDGIEIGLIESFKLLLQNLLQARKGGFNLNAPDFGGENIMDIFDAVDGFSFDLLLDGLLPKFDNQLSLLKDKATREGLSFPNLPDLNFLPHKAIDVPNLDLSAIDFDVSGIGALVDLGTNIGVFDADIGLDFGFSKADISDMFDDISSGLKPKEVFNFLRGDVDRVDFETITGLIKNPNIKAAMDEDFMKEIADTCAGLVDFALLDDMEKYYDDADPIGTLCENLGIDYGISPYPNVKSLADELADNYQGMSKEDIEKMIQDMLDALKDKLADVIGATGKNNTPFSEDPDSFMPSPSDIPAMDFVNDIALDAILNPIGNEYKREAASYVDNLMIPITSESLVPMYLKKGDLKVKEITSDYELVTEEVTEDFEYNPDFESYYKGSFTPLYDEEGNQIEAEILKADNSAQYQENLYFLESPGDDAHVKNLNSELKPPIAVIDKMDNKELKFSMGEGYSLMYGASKIEYSETTKVSYSDPSKGEDCDTTIESVTPADSLPPNQIFQNLVEQEIKNAVGGQDFLDAGIRDVISYVPEDLQQSGFFESILASLSRSLINTISNSRLFETINLYTMVFDSDEIDLLNLEASKKSAKEDYNEKFSFKEGGESQLSDSSIYAVVQLNFKIYIIESFMRTCFALDTLYSQNDLSETFCIKIAQSFKTDFLEYPEYIANVKSLVDIDDIPAFKAYLEPLYKEVTSKLNLVFEDAQSSFLEYLTGQGLYELIDSTKYDLPIEIHKASERGIKFVGIPYALASGVENIELDPLDLTLTDKRLRLCYIHKNGEFPIELPNWNNYDTYDYSGIQALSNYTVEEIVELLDSNSLSLSKDSVSLAMKASNEEYFVIPLIEDAYGSLVVQDSANELVSLQDRLRSLMSQFITEYIPLSDIYDLMLLELSYEVGIETPRVLTAFNGTKMLIKKTFDSLENSKDSYDHDDKESELTSRRAFEESGTSPEFSDVASNMALQTVPMIVKGLAENFDQNTQLASMLRQGADLAGVYIPAPIASLGIFGALGIIPNPIGAMYLATGFLEPKERKRIKEMLSGRNTSTEVSSAEEQQQQLQEASEAAREEQIAASVANLLIAVEALAEFRMEFTDNVFEDHTGALYFDSRESQFSHDYRIPKVNTYVTDTFIKMTGQWNFYNPSPPPPASDAPDELRIAIENFRNLLAAFNQVAYQLIYGSYEDDSGNSPFTVNDIEKEIAKQGDFENLRMFIKQALTQMFRYGEMFNALAIIYSNIEGMQLPYESPFASKSDYSTDDDYNAYMEKLAMSAFKSNSKGVDLVFRDMKATNYKKAINPWRDTSSGTYYKLYSSVLDFLEEEEVVEWIRDNQ